MAQSADYIKDSIGTEYRLHLGGNYFAETLVFSDKIHLVKYEVLDENVTTICLDEYIQLSLSQFDTIISRLYDIESVIPELSLVVPCYMREDHQNQEGAALCHECNPCGLFYC